MSRHGVLLRRHFFISFGFILFYFISSAAVYACQRAFRDMKIWEIGMRERDAGYNGKRFSVRSHDVLLFLYEPSVFFQHSTMSR
jgi:hypothetical protein